MPKLSKAALEQIGIALGEQFFDRHRLAGIRIESRIDLAEAALARFFFDGVFADSADHSFSIQRLIIGGPVRRLRPCAQCGAPTDALENKWLTGGGSCRFGSLRASLRQRGN
jgi:hypothetical protein